ncbi:MAG: hypothetical protein LKG14_01675 [Prevotella sp.]|nr:hypothetical protein [Prevotella sp.]
MCCDGAEQKREEGNEAWTPFPSDVMIGVSFDSCGPVLCRTGAWRVKSG